MPDILSVYAQSQPDKLAVIDDKPDGTVEAGPTPSLRRRPTGWRTCCSRWAPGRVRRSSGAGRTRCTWWR